MSRRLYRLTTEGITGPRQDGFYCLDLRGIALDERTWKYLPRDTAESLGVLPISFAGANIFIAGPDDHPAPADLRRELETLTGLPVDLLLSPRSQIEELRRGSDPGELI